MRTKVPDIGRTHKETITWHTTNLQGDKYEKELFKDEAGVEKPYQPQLRRQTLQIVVHIN